MNDDDQQSLRDLEHAAACDDPELAEALSRMRPLRRWRRTAAMWTTLSGSCGIPAGIIAEDSVLMLLGLCVLSVGAGLWHPAAP